MDEARAMSQDPQPYRYEATALSSESTVVAEFVSEQGVQDAAYQSEAALERELIAQLQKQAYEYLPITTEAELVANLRVQLEALNKLTFSDAEWQRFFMSCIAGANDSIVDKTTRIQEDHVQLLKRDDGSIRNIYLIDKQNIHNNRLHLAHHRLGQDADQLQGGTTGAQPARDRQGAVRGGP